MSPRNPSFEGYTALASKLKEDRRTGSLAPGWEEIVDSIDKTRWNDSRPHRFLLSLVYDSLIALTDKSASTSRTFRQEFSFFASNLENLLTANKTQCFVAPHGWTHIRGIDQLVRVVENIKMYDIDRLETGGLAALYRNGLTDLTHENYSHKISRLNQLVHTMQERKGHGPHLTYKEYILSLIALISHEDEVEIAMSSLTIEHSFWNQSWTTFEETKEILYHRFPSQSRSGTPPRVHLNVQLRELISKITKPIWYSPDEGVVNIRFNLVRAMVFLELPQWPQSIDVPADDRFALEDNGPISQRHNNESFSDLEKAVKELLALHKKHPKATLHSLSRFKPVSRKIHEGPTL